MDLAVYGIGWLGISTEAGHTDLIEEVTSTGTKEVYQGFLSVAKLIGRVLFSFIEIISSEQGRSELIGLIHPTSLHDLPSKIFTSLSLFTFPSQHKFKVPFTYLLPIHTLFVVLKMANFSVYPGLGLQIADFVNPQVLGATNPDAVFGFAHGECMHEEL
jgi:hypothetical protein